MNTILQTVRSFAREHDLLRPGPLVVAVSGGTDSSALLLLLAELRDEFGLVLHVAHFDHRVRARAAARDAAYVAELANRVGATLRVGRADAVPASEDEARRARYSFLRRVAVDRSAGAIATGHTRDDQAETVLLHLARGSGLAGLAGMRPSRDGIVRPLLRIGRADTTLVCRAARTRPREDPTNRSPRYARNRVRHRVLPELAAINPRVSEAIARLADAAAEVAVSSRAKAEAALANARRGDVIDLDLLGTDAPVREEALAIAWEAATGRILAARHRDALAALARSRDGSQTLDLPGGRALREYGGFQVVPLERAAARALRSARSPLVKGRAVEWNGWLLALGTARGAADAVARVGAELAGALEVRAWRRGDRLAGPVPTKVQDVFTDAKVPVRLRAGWPIVATAKSVWWVPGLRRPATSGGQLTLAVRFPEGAKNVLWSPHVRQVASKERPAARRPRKGRAPRT